jgi:hypothetical protein
MVSVMNDNLEDLLMEVVNADHFGEELYQRVFRTLGAEKKSSKLMVSIANALEEYYNYHNRQRIRLTGQTAREPIPPEADDQREELKLYIDALRHGITEFQSSKQLRSKLNQNR